MTRRLLIHCNAGVEYGMGHLMRSLAVAEQAITSGWTVRIGGDLTDSALSTAREMVPDSCVEKIPRQGVAAWILQCSIDFAPHVVHLDTYWDDADAALTGNYIVSSMQDATFGVRPADLAIDANLGSQEWFERPDLSKCQLAGIDATLIRGQVLRQRDNQAVPLRDRWRVLIVLGGTDPFNLTASVVKAFTKIDVPLFLTVVCQPGQEDRVWHAASQGRHEVRVCNFLDDLPATARMHDLVVSGAGTSVWDFACMGVAMALVCVTENQLAGYTSITDEGLALPLGVAGIDDFSDAMPQIVELLNDGTRLVALTNRLRETVDGRGAWRVVSAWKQMLETPLGIAQIPDLAARPFNESDGERLTNWRNDRASKYTQREGSLRSEHGAQMQSSQNRPSSTVMIIERDGEPLGAVEWEHVGHGYEVSLAISSAVRDPDLALATLRAGESALDTQSTVRLLASIPEDATELRELFAKAGYLPHLPADEAGISVHARWRFADCSPSLTAQA